jgi:hypothetical protein
MGNRRMGLILQGIGGLPEQNAESSRTLLGASEDRCSIQLSYGRKPYNQLLKTLLGLIDGTWEWNANSQTHL